MSQTNDEALRKFRAHRTLAAFKAASEPEPCAECDEDPITAAAEGEVILHGDMLLYDVMTGDGRIFDQDAMSWDLDVEGIPVLWDPENNDHDGIVLGRVDYAANVPGSIFGTARLFKFDDPDLSKLVATAAQLISENALGWSIRYANDVSEITIKDPQIETMDDGTQVVRLSYDDDVTRVKSGMYRHLALVDTPAFPGARPILGPPPALAAAASVATFPAAHFAKWESREAVPLQTTADGRFWGHAAGDGCFRDGSRTCTKYTRDSDPDLSNFHTSTATLDNGEVIRVGVLTAGGLHASTSLDLSGQRQHHENSSTIYAKVRAWEDAQGRLCISGSMIPGLDPAFAAQVAGLGLSVEKWPVGNRGLTLVGAHAVPTQAWPIL